MDSLGVYWDDWCWSDEREKLMVSHNIPKPKPLYEQNVAAVIRLCLKCNKSFSSIGNRICDKCGEKNIKVGKRVEHGGTRGIPGTIREGH